MVNTTGSESGFIMNSAILGSAHGDSQRFARGVASFGHNDFFLSATREAGSRRGSQGFECTIRFRVVSTLFGIVRKMRLNDNFLARGFRVLRDLTGGEGGIRTPGTLAGTTDFESAAIDHSATSPRGRNFSREGRTYGLARPCMSCARNASARAASSLPAASASGSVRSARRQ